MRFAGDLSQNSLVPHWLSLGSGSRTSFFSRTRLLLIPSNSQWFPRSLAMFGLGSGLVQRGSAVQLWRILRKMREVLLCSHRGSGLVQHSKCAEPLAERERSCLVTVLVRTWFSSVQYSRNIAKRRKCERCCLASVLVLSWLQLGSAGSASRVASAHR